MSQSQASGADPRTCGLGFTILGAGGFILQRVGFWREGIVPQKIVFLHFVMESLGMGLAVPAQKDGDSGQRETRVEKGETWERTRIY